MAITRQKKTEQVERLAKDLASSTTALVGTFSKLTVAQDFELRKAVRGAGGHYRVVKNKLASRAAVGSKVEEALKGLKGVSSVAYTAGDPVSLAKALSTWVEKNAEFTFKLGIIDGRLITVQEIDQLAKMPGREELFSKLLYLIQAPAQRLATVINATNRNIAVVINQAVEQGKFSGPAAAPVADVPVEAPKAETPAAEASPVATATETSAAAEATSEAAAADVVATPEAAANEVAAPEAVSAVDETSVAAPVAEAATPATEEATQEAKPEEAAS